VNDGGRFDRGPGTGPWAIRALSSLIRCAYHQILVATCIFLLAVLGIPRANAQDAPTPSPKPVADTKTEVSIQDSGTTFHLRVNLVQVHVVVRDNKGKPVENLRKEDFLLYDQGKLQPITTFSVETQQTRRAKAETAAKTQVEEGDTGNGADIVLPDRFVALVFDDTHLEMSDIVNVKTQVDKFIDSLPATDRIAIYSTSGQVVHAFTGDKEELKKTVLRLVPRPKFARSSVDCPDVSQYQADLAINKHDTQAMGVAVSETLLCAFQNNPMMVAAAQAMAQTAMEQALSNGDIESQYTYRYMEDVIRRLSGMPGERVMVMVSPGFLLTTQNIDMSEVVDRANHSGVVINTIDGRGLYTPDALGDISQPGNDMAQTMGLKSTYRIGAQTEQSYVLADFAYGTGGTFFHNSNDLLGGLELVGAAPEVSYVLGFSPQNQKFDGQFHGLKVVLTDKRKFTIQARRGYYAPKKVADPNQEARNEIQEAVFSRDEIMDLPLELQTQYFKADASSAHLSVVSRLQLAHVHFRKADGRNLDNLTLATAIFDDNGNFVTGGEKVVQMKLLDTTYEKMVHTGFVVKSSFDIKPGRYMIRQVVRDSEGAQMAARNGAVEIPN
jgi:VWFA-related protein